MTLVLRVLFTNVHDWHLANEILKTVLKYANKNGFRKVLEVRLELGGVLEHGEYILPKNLIHNFKLLAEKTIAKNAKLKIKKTKESTWRLVDIKGELY